MRQKERSPGKSDAPHSPPDLGRGGGFRVQWEGGRRSQASKVEAEKAPIEWMGGLGVRPPERDSAGNKDEGEGQPGGLSRVGETRRLWRFSLLWPGLRAQPEVE